MTNRSLEVPGVHPETQRDWERHLGRPIDAKSLRAELARGTLIEGFDESAEAYHDKPALIIDGKSATHGEIRSRSQRLAGWLANNGVKHGDRVLLWSKNSVEQVVAYVSILRAGAVCISVSPGSTAPELERLIDASHAEVALADPEQLRLLQSLDLHRRPRVMAPIASASQPGDRFLHSASTTPADVASLAFTSGTTGKPKATPLTHANQLATIKGAMMAWRWDPEDFLVHALPLSHGHGLGGLHATLLTGATALILSHFEPRRLCDAVAAHEATLLLAVPAIYQRLVEWEGFGSAQLSSLRLAVSGSAPLSPSLATKVADKLGFLPLERYGTTEGGLSISNPYEGRRKPGSVGFPLPGVEVMIVDDEGSPVANGEDGEIVVRGPQVFSGYLNTHPETGFFPGRWFRTGDVGRRDPADGYFSITGRQKEMIITGGLNVYPREIELAMEEHADVALAAVVGVPSDRWGEEVTAFVIPSTGNVDVTEIDRFLKERLAPYKVPKTIKVVESFPINALGKVIRPALSRLASSEHQRHRGPRQWRQRE